jgi:hypothetical protein
MKKVLKSRETVSLSLCHEYAPETRVVMSKTMIALFIIEYLQGLSYVRFANLVVITGRIRCGRQWSIIRTYVLVYSK